MSVQLHRIISPVFDSNCYVVVNEQRQALIVDPGAYTKEAIDTLLNKLDADAVAVLLTHGHPDHVWDSGLFSEAKVYIPKPDLYRMSDPTAYLGQMQSAFTSLVDYQYIEPEVLALPDECYTTAFEIIPNFYIRAIAAPGHTEGSSLFLFSCDIEDHTQMHIRNDYGLYAFCADVIFASSIGRTDLHGGDRKQMLQSIRTICNVIDPRTTLLTGHAQATTLSYVKQHNEQVVYAMRVG